MKENKQPLHHLQNIEVIYGIGNIQSPEVVECFGWWVVMSNQDVIIISQDAYCGNLKAEPYIVDEQAIYDDDWVAHLKTKGWFNEECEKDFINAISYARNYGKEGGY